MRISIVAPEFPPQIGGMENYALYLTNELKKNNEILIISGKKNKNIIIEKIKSFNAEGIFLLNAGLSPLIPEIKKFYSGKIIITAHGKDFIEPWLELGDVINNLPIADKIISISDFVKKKLISIGISKEKIQVIRHGVDTELFCPKEKNLGLLASLKIPKNQNLLLTVSRVHPIKNIEAVIKALPRLYGFSYLVVGPYSDTEYFEQLNKLVFDLNLKARVIFAGPIEHSNLENYYNLCDCFVMLNKSHESVDFESFGIAFLEAQACGKPVIGSVKGGAGEAFINGKTGFLIEPNENSLLNALEKLFCEKKFQQELGANAREHSLNFSWDKSAAEHFRLLL